MGLFRRHWLIGFHHFFCSCAQNSITTNKGCSIVVTHFIMNLFFSGALKFLGIVLVDGSVHTRKLHGKKLRAHENIK